MVKDHPIVILFDPYQVQRDELRQILKRELVISCRIIAVSSLSDFEQEIIRSLQSRKFDEKGLSLIMMANITKSDCSYIYQIVPSIVPTILVVDGTEAEEPHDGMANTVIGRKALKELSLKRLTNGTLNGLLK
jgi:hypothetical protein